MAEGINVRFAGVLQKFVQTKADKDGLYGSASEYIRDLVRRDYEKEEKKKWEWLASELKTGMAANKSEFVDLDLPAILAQARLQK
jgi:antitoxin ParD1/3/4